MYVSWEKTSCFIWKNLRGHKFNYNGSFFLHTTVCSSSTSIIPVQGKAERATHWSSLYAAGKKRRTSPQEFTLLFLSILNMTSL